MHDEEEDHERSRSSKNESSRGEGYGPGSFYGGEGHGRSGGYSSDRDDSAYGRTEQKYRSENYQSPRRLRPDSGQRTEYFEDDQQKFDALTSSQSPWRDTYEQDRPSYRDDAAVPNYNEGERSNNSRGRQYGSYRGYNDGSYSDQERNDRYRSGRRRNDDERPINNYDNQDESMEDEYGFRERYNDNRY